MKLLTDKEVLITGGCGSIGSQLAEQVLEHNPNSLRVLDNNEEGLFGLQERLGRPEEMRCLLGDIRDRERLRLAMENIDVVFHAAALKHVELNEYNPFEAVQTNVQGTQNLIRTAIDEEVESFVAISTDKASNPTSVMGATKLLAERLVIAANTYKGHRETRFGCVRFGNVLGSSKSVIPIFLEQIRNGGPVTVTDPKMTRFIMPIQRAADLVLDANARMAGGEVFILKMPAFQVGTLAEAMVEYYAPKMGYKSSEIEIEVIGPRPGERIHEKLISQDETAQTRELAEMYVMQPQIDISGYEGENYSGANPISEEYTSADTRLLPKDKLIQKIEEYHI